jgi:ribonuclease HI
MLTIYTDGSCNPNPGDGGWGVIAIFENNDVYLSGREKNTTNNVMELTAVIEALKEFGKHKKIKIISDSTYVINCAKGEFKRKKNVDLWKIYDEVSKDVEVVFEKVKAHSGDTYNELVDKLAKG